MANIKLTELSELITANNENTIFYVADLSVSPNVSHYIRLGHFTSDNAIAYYAYQTANDAYSRANVAYSVGYVANIAFNQANSVYDYSNSAYAFANTGYTQANNAASFANGAFTKANSAGSFSNGAFVTANSAASFANGAFVTANSAASFANGAFTKANSAGSFSNGAFVTANSAASFANGAFVTANNAVIRSGDTMSGTLNVPTPANGTYSTAAATAAMIQNELRNMRLSFYVPGMVIGTQYKRVDNKSTYSFAKAGQTGTFITDLNTSITPQFSTSKILVQMNLTFEVHHDTVFRLFRNVGGVDTEIGRNTNDANYWSGIWLPGYDADNSSTPTTNHYMYYDSPGTTQPVTYKLMIQSAGVSASTFYLNRSISSAGQDCYEVAISQVVLQEIYSL